MPGKPISLLDQALQPAPALRAAPLRLRPALACDGASALQPSREVVLRTGLGRSIPVRAAGQALDLPGGQAEDLAELADRPPRAEGREGRDQRRVIAPAAIVHTRGQ